MLGIWESIQICKIFARIWRSFHFYSLCVTVYYLWREVLGAHALYGHVAKCRNPILRAISPVPQNLYVEYLIQIHIFLAMKYASFRPSAYCRNHNGRYSHLRAKYGKSSQKKNCGFSLRSNTNVDWIFWFGQYISA